MSTVKEAFEVAKGVTEPDTTSTKVKDSKEKIDENIEELKEMGVATLITSTPDLGGRSFGTNVMEGVYSVILGKTKEDPPTVEEFESLLKKTDLRPRILPLNE